MWNQKSRHTDNWKSSSGRGNSKDIGPAQWSLKEGAVPGALEMCSGLLIGKFCWNLVPPGDEMLMGDRSVSGVREHPIEKHGTSLCEMEIL